MTAHTTHSMAAHRAPLEAAAQPNTSPKQQHEEILSIRLPPTLSSSRVKPRPARFFMLYLTVCNGDECSAVCSAGSLGICLLR